MSTKEASRRSPLHDEWARKVLDRAGHRCQGCGLAQSEIERLGGGLWAAHIYPYEEYPELRYDVSNGRASCTFLNRRHPQGRGHGFGCHNAQSGHWGKGGNNMPGVPAGRSSDRWQLAGLALLAASVVLFAIGLNAHSHQRAWFEGAFLVLAVSAPMWWAGARTFLASLELGTLLWVALLVLDGWLRRYPALRPYLLGQPKASFSGLLAWLVALLVLEGACLVLCYMALSGQWLSRGGHALLHALVRLARWARP